MVFLKIRGAQFLRELKSLGLFYALLLCVAGVAGLWFFYRLQEKSEPRFGSMLFILAMLVSIHFSRKDHRFIKLVAARPYRVYFSEYGAVALVVFILSFMKSQSLLLMLLFPLAGLLSFIPVSNVESKRTGWLGNLFPAANYEWKSGIRATGWMIPFLVMVAILVAPLPFASLSVCWVILALSMSFYEQGESRQMVASFMMRPSSFLISKTLLHCRTFLLLISPALVANLYFFPSKWWVGLFFVLFCALNIAVFVTSKYAVWQHGQMNRSASIINTICMVGIFVPFLLPFPIVVLLRNYRRATLNLKSLLNDYD